MRKLTFGLAVAISILPSAGRAQVTLDMTQMTCANYLAMSPDQARVFSAWMSGWFNQRWAITAEPEAASAPPVAERAGVIEIEFATGGRMRITGTVDAPTVTALMKALANGKRRR
jgi:HdeA/HdeB family protein